MPVRLATAATTILIGMACLNGCAKPLLGPVSARPTTASARAADPWDWSQCLHENVRDGRIHYARLAEEPGLLDRVLKGLAIGDEPNDSVTRRTARLINAYNAFAMRAGLERYRAAGGDPDRARRPYEEEYRFCLHGRHVTLADIRARLLSGETPDARILFALCPAAAGMPLCDQPFEPATLDRQLSAVAAAAMNDPQIVRVDHENRLLWVSDVIGRSRSVLIRWYERRTGAVRAELFNALLDLADDSGRDRLNTAIGYRVVVRPTARRLNIYVPTASE